MIEYFVLSIWNGVFGGWDDDDALMLCTGSDAGKVHTQLSVISDVCCISYLGLNILYFVFGMVYLVLGMSMMMKIL